jgi:hypothetical protein
MPEHFATIIVEIDACFGEKIRAKDHVILVVIVVKDGSFLLQNLSDFVKLWEAYVTQSDYLLSNYLAGQGYNIFAVREVFENDSRG